MGVTGKSFVIDEKEMQVIRDHARQMGNASDSASLRKIIQEWGDDGEKINLSREERQMLEELAERTVRTKSDMVRFLIRREYLEVVMAVSNTVVGPSEVKAAVEENVELS